jgi:sortase A
MWKSETPEHTRSESESGTSRAFRRNFGIWIETLLLAFGITAIAVFCAARIDSYLGARRALREFANLSSSSSSAPTGGAEEVPKPTMELDSPDVDFNDWNQRRQQEYLRSTATPSGKPIAVLRIPRIHLEVPVLEGTDDLTLNRGAGRIAGTARFGDPGNIGIAAHRDSFFRGLKDVHVGDTIELASPKGRDNYVVDRIQIVTPDNVKVLEPGVTPSVTLVTCYPFYFIGDAPRRYIVTASLVHGEPNGSVRAESSNANETGNRP